MKKFKTTLALIAICGLAFTSCSDDDDDSSNSPSGSNPPASSSSISFNGNTYNLQSGIVEDYGTASFGGFNDSHYNYDFTTIDGTITQDPDPNVDTLIISENTSILVYIELFAPDTSTFKTGTFTYIPVNMVTEASVKDKYFFSYGEVGLDNDGVVGGNFDGPYYEVVGGSVVVSGTSPANYNLNYNLQLEGGRTLTGTYTGSFFVFD